MEMRPSKVYRVKKSRSSDEKECGGEITDADRIKWLADTNKSLRADIDGLKFELESCRLAKNGYINAYTALLEKNNTSSPEEELGKCRNMLIQMLDKHEDALKSIVEMNKLLRSIGGADDQRQN